MSSRREFIIGLGSTASALVVSNLLPDLNGFSVQAATYEIASVEEFLNAFEEDFDWQGESQLLNPDNALYQIHQKLGLQWAFDYNVGYHNASQCQSNFQKCEADFRNKSATIFTDVQRAKQDRDVAYLVGGIYGNNRLGEVFGATQFQGNSAIKLIEDDASILLEGARIYSTNYLPQQSESAQLATLITKPVNLRTTTRGSEERRRDYETPRSQIIHYPKPIRHANRLYNKGLVAVRRKNSSEKWKFKGLYV